MFRIIGDDIEFDGQLVAWFTLREGTTFRSQVEDALNCADVEAVPAAIGIEKDKEIKYLREELGIAQQAVRDWRRRCEELQAPKPRRRR
jgi:hypothetical protein